MPEPNERELELAASRYSPCEARNQHARDLADYREELLNDPKTKVDAAVPDWADTSAVFVRSGERVVGNSGLDWSVEVRGDLIFCRVFCGRESISKMVSRVEAEGLRFLDDRAVDIWESLVRGIRRHLEEARHG